MAKIKCVINQSVGEVVWGPFATGKSITLHTGRVSAANLAYAMFHGLKQRGSDVMALQAKDYGGRVPESAKWDELKAMVDYLESGATEWARRATSAEREAGGLLFRCVMEYRPGRKPEAVQAFLRAMTPTERADLLESPGILPIAQRLRAESARKVDTDAALAGLDEMEVEGGGEMSEDEEIAELMTK